MAVLLDTKRRPNVALQLKTVVDSWLVKMQREETESPRESMIQVNALQHLIYEFAGPWGLIESIEIAIDHSAVDLSWVLPITNWRTCLSGDWDLVITLDCMCAPALILF